MPEAIPGATLWCFHVQSLPCSPLSTSLRLPMSLQVSHMDASQLSLEPAVHPCLHTALPSTAGGGGCTLCSILAGQSSELPVGLCRAGAGSGGVQCSQLHSFIAITFTSPPGQASHWFQLEQMLGDHSSSIPYPAFRKQTTPAVKAQPHIFARLWRAPIGVREGVQLPGQRRWPHLSKAVPATSYIHVFHCSEQNPPAPIPVGRLELHVLHLGCTGHASGD